MSFISAMVNIEFFCLILLGGFFITWVEPKVTISEFEKRPLTPLPSFGFIQLFDGHYTDSLDMYYADHFGQRDQWVELKATIKGLFGFRSHDLMVYESENPDLARLDSLQIEDARNAHRDSLRASRQIKKDPNGLPPDRKNSILIYNGMAFQLFGRYGEAEKNFAAMVNYYKYRLGDTCRVFACLVPSAIDFYLPRDYKSKSNYEKPSIDSIYSRLDPTVRTVDAYRYLEDAADDFIYFKTDHHWTARGAYQAYLAFCRSAGFTATSLSSFDRQVRKPFLGSLYYATLDTRLRNSGDSLEYFLPPTESKAWRYPEKDLKKIVPTDVVNKRLGRGGSYLVFIGGDYPLTHIITSHKNGRKIFMIKDSFGNALAPFLTSHYEEIFVADYRSFDSNVIRFIMRENIDDLLFLHNIAVANNKYSASRESYLTRTRDLAPQVTRDTTSVVE